MLMSLGLIYLFLNDCLTRKNGAHRDFFINRDHFFIGGDLKFSTKNQKNQKFI
jgi:hypothetical protein